MRANTQQMTHDQLAAWLLTVDWWRRYSVGQALKVGRKTGAPATPRTRMELARAICRVALPKQYVKGGLPVPMGHGQ